MWKVHTFSHRFRDRCEKVLFTSDLPYNWCEMYVFSHRTFQITDVKCTCFHIGRLICQMWNVRVFTTVSIENRCEMYFFSFYCFLSRKLPDKSCIFSNTINCKITHVKRPQRDKYGHKTSLRKGLIKTLLGKTHWDKILVKEKEYPKLKGTKCQ